MSLQKPCFLSKNNSFLLLMADGDASNGNERMVPPPFFPLLQRRRACFVAFIDIQKKRTPTLHKRFHGKLYINKNGKKKKRHPTPRQNGSG